METQRISLGGTRVTSYQSSEVEGTLSKNVDSSAVVDYSKSTPKAKQSVYFILVVGIFVAAIAVTFFMFDKNSNGNGMASSGASNNDEIEATSSKKKDKDWFLDKDLCYESDYLKTSLKLQYSANFGGIIMDLQNTNKYEASGVRYDRIRNKFFVVFDSLYGLGSIDLTMQRSTENKLIADNSNGVIGESGFEGLALDPETNDMHLVTEAIEYVGHEEFFRAIIHHISFGESDSYDALSSCAVDYNFTSSNKGLEGLSLLQNSETGEKYFIGLCEGNYCQGGKNGRKSGHGRMLSISFDFDTNTNGECIHSVIDEIHLPSSAYFTDYSALSFKLEDTNYYKVAIASQEDSAMWVGYFDLSKMQFDDDAGYDIYVFPKNLDCSTIYCNIEGIAWIDDNTIVAVSDKTKSKGKQDYQCSLGDQSIFLFTIP